METTVTGTLRVVERLRLSRLGNPAYLVAIGDRVYKTWPNGSIAYEITNFDGRDVRATLEPYRGQLALVDVESVER